MVLYIVGVPDCLLCFAVGCLLCCFEFVVSRWFGCSVSAVDVIWIVYAFGISIRWCGF